MKSITKQLNTARRKARSKAKVSGTDSRPRVSVRTSLTGMFVQFIDDSKGVTLLSGRDKGFKGNKTQRAESLGVELGKKAVNKGINSVVLDRGARKYHGRVATLADSLRKAGLIF